MSTEHQQYSTENQADAIRQYAERRGIDIVRTYADEGKSGLRMEGRNGLKQLINDVETGTADFEAILVYDVSRWGRFQDADESAYYEYICRRADIAVHYCAEQFENDGSPVATIVKGVKRAMAGEYSRELSAKVFAGQCRLIELGYRQGGAAGYGLRRMLVDQQGHAKGVLRQGQQKSLQTDRVVLVPGPPEEVAIIREIYRLFVDEGRVESEIASSLNARGVVTDLGRSWTRSTVHQVLTNEKYIGNNVYNRVSFKLKKKRVVNPPDIWIRREGAFEPLVEPRLFYTAQGMIRERSRRLSNEELLGHLQRLFGRHGHLSGLLIDETRGHALQLGLPWPLRKPDPRLWPRRLHPGPGLSLHRDQSVFAPDAPGNGGGRDREHRASRRRGRPRPGQRSADHQRRVQRLPRAGTLSADRSRTSPLAHPARCRPQARYHACGTHGARQP
jgi:DNA invertase Pin-like site-specific DNA recombinase